MSSTVFPRNEARWAHMGMIPYPRHHRNAKTNSNPNPRKKLKKFHGVTGNEAVGRQHNNLESPVVAPTVSDDAYSFNLTSTSRNAACYGRYMTFNIASYSQSELLELRNRLYAELKRIRDLQNLIESGHFRSTGNPRLSTIIKKAIGNQMPLAAIDSAPNRPLINGSVNKYPEAIDFESLLKDCKRILVKLMKVKHAYIFKIPVDAVALGLHDYHHIVKHPMDLGTVKARLAKNQYSSPVEFAADVRLTFNNALLYNPKTDPVHSIADQMLCKFEELFGPIQEKVDNYVNQPRKREFQEFSTEDEMQLWKVQELQQKEWDNHIQSFVSPSRGKKVKQRKVSPIRAPHVLNKLEKIRMPAHAHSTVSMLSHPPGPPPLVNHHQLLQAELNSSVNPPVKDQNKVRGGIMKLPKPMTGDQYKRKMTMDEKQKLGMGLQSLPQEIMPQLVEIIRKGIAQFTQDGDEIELDIDALDAETLWELNRFVMNWKKFTSKSMRPKVLVNQDLKAGIAVPSSPISQSDMNQDTIKILKDDDEEDVDIDDDMPAAKFLPVEIEKDQGFGIGGVFVKSSQDHEQNHNHEGRGNYGGSNSSDSSDSDSSSLGDSGSTSSGSDSDADDVQS